MAFTSKQKIAALVAGIAAAAFVVWFVQRSRPLAPPTRFTGSTTVASEPAWSPDGTTLAYLADVNGVAQVFTQALQSGEASQVTQSAVPCAQPFWSPQGTQIYYTSAGRLWSIGSQGGDAKPVLDNVFQAAISPDGTAIVFLSRSNPAGPWISSPPGAEPHPMDYPSLQGKQYFGGYAAFAPDGTRLGLWLQPYGGDPEFWIVPYPHGEPRRFFYPWWILRISKFQWLPDSRRIVFSDRSPNDRESRVWIADTESGERRQLGASGYQTQPALSPDGRRIAFSDFLTEADLLSVSLADGSWKTLLSTPASEGLGVWTPSGEEFVYVTDRNGPWEIWAHRIQAGTDRAVVTQKDFGQDTTLLLTGLAISPDGKRLVYSRFGNSVGRGGILWISPVAGGPPVRAMDPSEDDNPQLHPAWSPDGNSIAFVSSRQGNFSLAITPADKQAKSAIVAGLPTTVFPDWSPRNDLLVFPLPAGGIGVLHPNPKQERIVTRSQAWITAAFPKGSRRAPANTQLYAIRARGRAYTVASVDIVADQETLIGSGELPVSSSLMRPQQISIAPDSKSALVTVNRTHGAIWISEIQ